VEQPKRRVRDEIQAVSASDRTRELKLLAVADRVAHFDPPRLRKVAGYQAPIAVVTSEEDTLFAYCESMRAQTRYARPYPIQLLIDESHQRKRAVVVDPDLILGKNIQGITVINRWDVRVVVVGNRVGEGEDSFARSIEACQAGLNGGEDALIVVSDPNL